MENEKRTGKYRKNPDIEKYLAMMNDRLDGIDEEIRSHLSGAYHPIIFVVGSQRSGTTYLSQLLINNFKLRYPSNFIARFWKAPLLGTTLFDQLYPEDPEISWNSDMGYTEYPDGLHEFGYFWKENLRDIDENLIVNDGLGRLMGSLTQFTMSPWLFKNLHFVNFAIKEIYKAYPKSYFIHIKRDLIDNAVSTYESRIKIFGKADAWFGPRPSTYEKIKYLDPYNQILRQIHQVNNDIQLQGADIPASHFYRVEYKDLLTKPDSILEDIQLLAEGINRRFDSFVKPETQNKSKKDKSLVEEFSACLNRLNL